MSEHHTHYFNHVDENMRDIITSQRIDQPLFIGQGWTSHIGSDCYGGYVVAKKQIGHKTLWGLCRAETCMCSTWTEGTQDCFLPQGKIDPATVVPYVWIVQSGFYKDSLRAIDPSRPKHPKFSFCNPITGRKYPRSPCRYSWNGAYSYQDPNF